MNRLKYSWPLNITGRAGGTSCDNLPLNHVTFTLPSIFWFLCICSSSTTMAPNNHGLLTLHYLPLGKNLLISRIMLIYNYTFKKLFSLNRRLMTTIFKKKLLSLTIWRNYLYSCSRTHTYAGTEIRGKNGIWKASSKFIKLFTRILFLTCLIIIPFLLKIIKYPWMG